MQEEQASSGKPQAPRFGEQAHQPSSLSRLLLTAGRQHHHQWPWDIEPAPQLHPGGWKGWDPWDAAAPLSFLSFNRRHQGLEGEKGFPRPCPALSAGSSHRSSSFGEANKFPWSIPTQLLTHPEVVKPLGHGPVLRRDLRIEVLVETWLQGDELGQGREVVHLFCKEKFRWHQALPRAKQNPRGFLNSPKN